MAALQILARRGGQTEQPGLLSSGFTLGSPPSAQASAQRTRSPAVSLSGGPNSEVGGGDRRKDPLSQWSRLAQPRSAQMSAATRDLTEAQRHEQRAAGFSRSIPAVLSRGV